MIVSHRHRFIFVKTAKTAGSSVELYLRQFCGPDDIVPYLGPDDERLARSIGAGRPRNHGIRRLMPWEIRSENLADARRRRRLKCVSRQKLPTRIMQTRLRKSVALPNEGGCI